MADASKRPPSSSQRQSPPTSLAHRTRAPQHARRQPSPSSGPRDAAAGIHGANHAAAADDDDDDDDEDYTSSSGSDSDSDGAESDDENDGRLDRDRTRDGDGDGDGDGNDGDSVPHVSGRAKPRIHRVQDDQGLMARLSAFLPQMKTANEDLQREIDAGRAMDVRLDEVDEQSEGRYIEMVCYSLYFRSVFSLRGNWES